MKKFSLLFLLLFPLIVEASSGDDESTYPKSARRERWAEMDSIIGGEEKGITIFDSNPDKKSFFAGGGRPSGASAMTVNPYLWQAALDIVSFMPIKSSDSAGGVVSTDWYEDPEYPGERYRVNVLIKAVELNVNNLKVTVFKQKLKDNNWREVKPSDEISQDLEAKILTKAREMKIAQEH
ncbi:MAG: DUF3576 domain-containing protein [Rickettsiales bacterium]